MLSFPNCKINLGLSIINKRSDGFHDLETIFYPLPINDALEIIPSQHDEIPTGKQRPVTVNFTTSGLTINGDNIDNLCMKAWLLLREDFPQLPSIKMHLHKVIPMGAGLGGGSADGAFVLILLNALFNLGLSTTELIGYALKLGSDCPFFIINKPCFATGRGEIMEPVSLDLSAYTFVLVNDGITVNTGWAFTQLNTVSNSLSTPVNHLKDLISNPVSTWKDTVINDFEKPVFEKYPSLKTIKNRLYKLGALYASMSGSGSTIFGIFDKDHLPDNLQGLGNAKLLTPASLNL